MPISIKWLINIWVLHTKIFCTNLFSNKGFLCEINGAEIQLNKTETRDERKWKSTDGLNEQLPETSDKAIIYTQPKIWLSKQNISAVWKGSEYSEPEKNLNIIPHSF